MEPAQNQLIMPARIGAAPEVGRDGGADGPAVHAFQELLEAETGATPDPFASAEKVAVEGKVDLTGLGADHPLSRPDMQVSGPEGELPVAGGVGDMPTPAGADRVRAAPVDPLAGADQGADGAKQGMGDKVAASGLTASEVPQPGKMQIDSVPGQARDAARLAGAFNPSGPAPTPLNVAVQPERSASPAQSGAPVAKENPDPNTASNPPGSAQTPGVEKVLDMPGVGGKTTRFGQVVTSPQQPAQDQGPAVAGMIREHRVASPEHEAVESYRPVEGKQNTKAPQAVAEQPQALGNRSESMAETAMAPKPGTRHPGEEPSGPSLKEAPEPGKSALNKSAPSDLNPPVNTARGAGLSEHRPPNSETPGEIRRQPAKDQPVMSAVSPDGARTETAIPAVSTGTSEQMVTRETALAGESDDAIAAAAPAAVRDTNPAAPPARIPGWEAHAPKVMEQIAHAAVALRDRPVELLLNPEELGRVRMTLQVQDGAMVVTVSAERPDTLDYLRRHIDQLATQLKDLGYSQLDFAFASRSGDSFGGEGGRQDHEHSMGRAVSGDPESQETPHIQVSFENDGRLDIRL